MAAKKLRDLLLGPKNGALERNNFEWVSEQLSTVQMFAHSGGFAMPTGRKQMPNAGGGIIGSGRFATSANGAFVVRTSWQKPEPESRPDSATSESNNLPKEYRLEPQNLHFPDARAGCGVTSELTPSAVSRHCGVRSDSFV